jgi:hypothetical protein
MGADFGRQDCTGTKFVIFAPLRSKVTEMIHFRGQIEEAHKRARLYSPTGSYKIIRARR